MKRVLMKATRRTDAGLLKEGKAYPVPDSVAASLIESGAALSLESPGVERAVKAGPSENAALGRSDWPLKTPPDEYLRLYGDDSKHSDKAREIVGASDD